MPAEPALHGEPSLPRVLVVDDGTPREVFDVLGIANNVARVRSAFLFEIGEELTIRIEQDGAVTEAIARVRAHIGPDEARVTELEISERSEPHNVVSG
jgi:hypothetical protein